MLQNYCASTPATDILYGLSISMSLTSSLHLLYLKHCLVHDNIMGLSTLPTVPIRVHRRPNKENIACAMSVSTNNFNLHVLQEFGMFVYPG